MNRSSYSTADVARRLGVSIPTVQRWVDAGRLKAWKTPGGHRRIDAGSADAMFRAQDGHADGEPVSVVVLDGDPADREQLVGLVESALPGARVSTAGNGYEGLLTIGQVGPELVIADLALPRIDGLELLDQLLRHATLPPPRLVIATGLPAAAEPAPVLPPGVRYVAKPLDPAHFESVVRDGLPSRPQGAR
jgi:excisionase family DNA binding protein